MRGSSCFFSWDKLVMLNREISRPAADGGRFWVFGKRKWH